MQHKKHCKGIYDGSVVFYCLNGDAELYSKCLHSTSNHAIRKAGWWPGELIFPRSAATCGGGDIKRPFTEAVKSVQTTGGVFLTLGSPSTVVLS